MMAKMDNLDTKKERQAAFLRAYARTGVVSRAAKAAKVPRSTYYAWYEQDADFRAAVKEAKAAAVEAMEYEAWRRAVKGVRRPHYYRGQVAGYIREYSDVLLMFLLKANDPEKYKEHVAADIRGDGLTIVVGGKPIDAGGGAGGGEQPGEQ